MRIAVPGCLVLALSLFLFAMLGCVQGAPIRSKTHIIHMLKNATHLDVMAKHAWYAELMKQAKEVLLPEDDADDGMDTLHHVYHHVFDGFSARLTPEQVVFMESLPCVRGVYRDRIHRAHTTHTPEFLGLAGPGEKLWPESKYGDDVIIGLIDSGIWPERLSFSDGLLGAIPQRWKGVCQTGTNFTTADCSKKIIGARWFSKGYESEFGPIIDTVTEYKSPRGFNHHGTHTASIAAGRWAYRASVGGLARGTARGMAPRARIAVYKAMWGAQGEGTSTDILQAIEHAVADGVDVISASLGGITMVDFFQDPEAIGYYNAVKRGIFVSKSAGNHGPTPGSVVTVAPWLTTVAATTTDRDIDASIVLGNGEILPSSSKFKMEGMPEVALVYAGDAAMNASVAESASFCEAGTLNASLIAGKVLLCNYDKTIHTGLLVPLGIAGFILANTVVLGETLNLQSFSQDYPMGYIGNQARERAMAYIRGASSPTASIRTAAALYGAKPAPAVSGFSSRGPILRDGPHIWLKPDIAAPGIDILAAGSLEDLYIFDSGTSMACPHISGIGALLRAAHPDWSPAAIKSAIMTTATTLDNTNSTITDQVTSIAATPWDFGAGFVQPERAMDPGLVYDMGSQDHLLFLCGLGYDSSQMRVFDDAFVCPSNPPARVEDANLPSFVAQFTIASLSAADSSIAFQRSLTNVATPSDYRASVDVQPRGFQISIEPATLSFAPESSIQRFTLIVEPHGAANLPEVVLGQGLLSSGSVSWSDGEHIVQSPVAVLAM